MSISEMASEIASRASSAAAMDKKALEEEVIKLKTQLMLARINSRGRRLRSSSSPKKLACAPPPPRKNMNSPPYLHLQPIPSSRHVRFLSSQSNHKSRSLIESQSSVQTGLGFGGGGGGGGGFGGGGGGLAGGGGGAAFGAHLQALVSPSSRHNRF